MLQVSLELLIILALIVINGMLALSELAVVSARGIRLQQRAEKGDQGAAAALALAKEPTRFLSTVQIGITLVGILTGAVAGTSLAERLAGAFRDAGLSEGLSNTLAVVCVVFAITYLSLVFGEIVPKRIALHQPERVASLVSRPMQLLSRAASPFVFVLSASTGAVLRLLGLHRPNEDGITEEEIRLMIGLSAQSGTVAEAEAELLDRVFHFGDRRVYQVMVPRTEVVWLDDDATLSDFYDTFHKAPHSRFPIAVDDLDNVIGILGIKDVTEAVAEARLSPDSPVKPEMRTPMFVPETKLVGELFREMQAGGVQMAVAVDEHGGTAGVVTLEQLLEEMVGQVRDENVTERPEVRSVGEGTFQVDGSLSVAEARELLDMDIPEGPYDTIAGFVLNELGHIPSEGEFVLVEDQRITVAEMVGPKVETLRVTRGG